MVKIDIGGGPFPAHPDYIQVDAIDWSERTGLEYVIADARALPFDDRSCEVVFASNLLEHFPPTHTTAVLIEWTRVLCRGGQMELIVPDSMGILRDHFKGINSWKDCEERLRGSRDYAGNEHFNAFDLWSFPQEIARVPGLRLLWCKSSHAGGGVHSLSEKEA
jgi:hypothetical protein